MPEADLDDREPGNARANSEFFLDRARPTLVTVPPGIWHGAESRRSDCAFLNFVDRLYEHGNPDEWRLPAANDAIPYRF
jgi:dTDP-4-dehydrorhamnose 3,5-epimerase